MVWRGLYTLNTEDPVSLGASLAVFVAELYGVGGMAFFYLQVINPLQRSTARSDVGARPTVDVFVTICDEPIDILRRTLVACQAMEYPADRKRIFVLDDAGRADVRQLAARLGCVYLSRPTHEHAKAGNLNFALAHSHGALVLIFDTDHVPVRTFLLETVGQFEDLKVAIVQTPHHFYNPDLFQRNFRLQDRLVNEQDLFFQVVQPGRDRHNSVFFCGSGGIFRRAALDEIGGFATASVTEDIHTSVLLHAKGYRSVYVNKRLAAGLAPESYASYLRQRQRWTRGHLQIFLSAHNPLFVRGLTVAQRIDYFASIYYFLLGPARMVFLLAPLVYLLFGKYVVVTDLTSLLTFYVAHYIGGVVASGVLARGFRNPFWGDLYETVMSVPLTSTTVATVLLRRPWPFLVTPKGIRSPGYRRVAQCPLPCDRGGVAGGDRARHRRDRGNRPLPCGCGD
jgi:cellulose synthase (UDP-forming)